MTPRSTCGIVGYMASVDNLKTKFHELIQDQIRNEFTASQQYTAMAVYFDGADLPQ